MISRLRSPNVFVNVPFDDKYEPLFEALVFTISACGYRVRCALEDDDSGDIRLDKLVELIRECPRSIHDLSRIEPGENDLPRFNMPFELGLALGAKRFGHRPGDRIKIMVADPYRLPAYLSDLGGNDPSAHKNESAGHSHCQYLSTAHAGRRYVARSRQTSGRLLEVQGATSRGREGNPLPAWRSEALATIVRFVWCVTEILKKANRVAERATLQLMASPDGAGRKNAPSRCRLGAEP